MGKKRLIKNCNRTYEVTDLLARLIKKDPKYKDCKIETYGPFGLNCECSIFVKQNDEIIGDLTIIYGYGESKFRRRTYENTYTYPDGSIGALNGDNYKSYDLPLDNEQCLKLVFEETER